jgi:HSP20 family protein
MRRYDMSLIARNNVSEFNRFFNEAWPQRAVSQGDSSFAPRVDIAEAEDHYEITAELPGVDKKDIQIHVKDGVLTLEAQTAKDEQEEKKGRVIRQERRYGKFVRSFNLGQEVQEADIKALFKDGVLTLQAPKMVEKEQEPRRIEIA